VGEPESFQRQDDDTPRDDPGNPTVNFHGEARRGAARRNDPHQSTTDRDACARESLSSSAC
jgi:hypothetical protein